MTVAAEAGGTDTVSATARLWERRDRRVPAAAAAVALSGLPFPFVRDAARISLADSAEAAALLDHMSARIRNLPLRLVDTLERCEHSVRGPVIWSETITARANALGNEDVFVCSTARRTFDSPENRVLVRVLAEIALASKALRGPVGEMLEHADRNRLDDLAVAARQWRHHRRLDGVTPMDPRPRDLARIRSGRHGDAAEITLAALARLHDPFDAVDLEGLCGPPARRDHELIVACVDALGDEPGGHGARLVLDGGALWWGELSYRHPSAPGTAPAGVAVAGQSVTSVEDLTSPAGSEDGPVGSAQCSTGSSRGS